MQNNKKDTRLSIGMSGRLPVDANLSDKESVFV